MNPYEEIKKLLLTRGLTISTAESCTGGLIAKLITDVPGASEIFKGAVVAYDNLIKERVLNVPAETIKRYGAVSVETAEAMAYGVKKLLETDTAIAVSGIAGPCGGTEAKPVGTVCFAFAFPDGTKTETAYFQGGRDTVRRSAADFAVKACIELLINNSDSIEM